MNQQIKQISLNEFITFRLKESKKNFVSMRTQFLNIDNFDNFDLFDLLFDFEAYFKLFFFMHPKNICVAVCNFLIFN